MGAPVSARVQVDSVMPGELSLPENFKRVGNGKMKFTQIALTVILAFMASGIVIYSLVSLDHEIAELKKELARERGYNNTLIIRRSDDLAQRAWEVLWSDRPAFGQRNLNEDFSMKIKGVEIDFSQANIKVSQGAHEAHITISNLRFKEGKEK